MQSWMLNTSTDLKELNNPNVSNTHSQLFFRASTSCGNPSQKLHKSSRANLQTGLRGNADAGHDINCRRKSSGHSQELLACHLWYFLVTSEPSWQKNFTVEAQRVSTGNIASLTTQIHNSFQEYLYIKHSRLTSSQQNLIAKKGLH